MKRTLTQQEYIDGQKRSRKAKALAWGEKTAAEQYDALYKGKSTDNSSNYDKQEINSWIEP